MYRSTCSWPRYRLEVSGQLHTLSFFITGEIAPDTHSTSGWVGPRASLDDVEKILDPTRTRTPTPQSSSPYPVSILNTLSPILEYVVCRHLNQCLKTGFGLVIGFINHLQAVTTSSYTAPHVHTTQHSTLLSSVYLLQYSRIYNTGTIKVSLNHTLPT
jgi:hypothetical protein